MPDPSHTDVPEPKPTRPVAMVFSGGAAMGAYEAGAFAALQRRGGWRPSWLAGSSIGAVTAAIIAGSPPDRQIQHLRQFWDGLAHEPSPFTAFWLGSPAAGPWRQALNEKSVLDALLLGRPGLFQARLATVRRAGVQDVPALYDLEPLRERLSQIVDFDLLNSGNTRVSLACTDILSGDRVMFDTARGDRIGVQHVLASCALLPTFAPVEVGGRLLGDGGLSANAPLDVVLDDTPDEDTVCFVVELFARQGSRPHTLAASANRAADLILGNQTRRTLDVREREYRLRGLIGKLASHLPAGSREQDEVAAILKEGRTDRITLATISYRGGIDEAGFLKLFDFSKATLADRWRGGEAAMAETLAALAGRSQPGDATIDITETVGAPTPH